MTLLEHELAQLPNDVLRRMAASTTPTVATAAQAELDSRPSAQTTDPAESLRHTIFPS